MPVFTTTNAVLIALMQVGVIVAGVLTSGLIYKLFNGREIPPPVLTVMLRSFGFLGLAIPVLWTASVLRVRQCENVSEDTKVLAFWSGILILVALIIFFGYADLGPLLSIDGRVGATNGD